MHCVMERVFSHQTVWCPRWEAVGFVVSVLLTFGITSAAAQTLFPSELSVSQLDGQSGVVIRGVARGDATGTGVAGVADFNGDSVADLFVGAPFAAREGKAFLGEAYVLFGELGFGSGGVIPLQLVNGENGFLIRGSRATDNLGERAAALDINADGYSDMAVAAVGADDDILGQGSVFVIFGGPGVGATGQVSISDLDGSNGFAIRGSNRNELVGFPANAGDVNGDGIDDLLVGAPRSGPQALQGQLYVIYGGPNVGRDGELRTNQFLTGVGGFTIRGAGPGDFLSDENAGSVGDFNDDGIADIAVGSGDVSIENGEDSGIVYVLLGGAWLNDATVVNVGDLTPPFGFLVEGLSAGNRLGESVALDGDFNGDGVADLVSGARGSFEGVAGNAFIVFGGADRVPSSGVFDLTTIDGFNGARVTAAQTTDGLFGVEVAYAGDLNNDGLDDVAISDAIAEDSQSRDVGIAYVVFGRRDAVQDGLFSVTQLDGNNGFSVVGVTEDGDLGVDIAALGDINADGIDDFIVGAPLSGPVENGEPGEAFVVFGRDQGLDTDADSVEDFRDNCLLVSNSDQRDTDEDGYGNICDADLNSDCIVNAEDWLMMRAALGSDDGDADLDGDGVVTGLDALILVRSRFEAPGPSGTTDTCDPF